MSVGGYATYDPTTDPVPLGRNATAVAVFRLVDDEFEPMPYLRCLAIEAEVEGGEPTRATFRYRFADPNDANPDALAGFEEVYPLDATGPAVVRIDDRLVVAELDPDGEPVIVFDGFAQVPDLALGPETQQVQIVALGAECRCNDLPLAGSTWRDADEPDSNEDHDVETDLDLAFNPTKEGEILPTMLKNRSAWSGEDETTYPVFLDPTVPYSDDKTNPRRTVWTLAGAVRYILGTANADEEFVRNPDFAALDALFQVKVAKDGADDSTVDPKNPATYDLKDLTLPPDLNLEGRRWPEAIRLLIEPFGYGLCFRLSQDDDGLPVHDLDLYRKDDASDEVLVDLYLQAPGNDLDPAQTNVGSANLNRDASGLANQIWVTTGIVSYEASLVLAPGFKIDAGDVSAGTTNKFKLGDPAHVGDALNAYRRFIVDEAGEGHWDLKGKTWESGIATSLDDILAPPGIGNAFGERVSVNRRRVGGGQLFSRDPLGDRLSAQLWVSTDYKGNYPAVWDGTGTWQQVQGSWELLDDCLGVRLTCQDPGDLQIGKPSSAGSSTAPTPFASGKLNLIQALAAPNTGSGATGTYPLCYFRLTCLVPSDHDLQVVANRRNTSVTKYAIEQRDDARDRFTRWTITKSSHLNTTGAAIVARDDSQVAQAYADARRSAHELGPTAGPVTIPRLTRAYQVGDKVRQIVGRDVSLAQNVGAGQGEAPVYPSVVRIERVYDPEQRTVLGLSDRRGEPRRVGR